MTSPDALTRFPARFYLEKYYSHVRVENAAFMRAVGDAVAGAGSLGTVVELGGGPSLCGLLAMAAATDEGPARVVWIDAAPSSLDQVAAWLRDDAHAFGYEAVLRWLAETMGADPAALATRLRAASWHLHCADLRTGLPAAVRGVGDVVGSYFLAEAATDQEPVFVELTRRVGEAAAPGARVALAYVRRSGPYRLQDATLHPALAVDESSLPGMLDAAGLRFAELALRRGPRDDPPARPDYEGMVFATGRLARPS